MDKRLAVAGLATWLLVANGCASTYAGSRASASYSYRSPGTSVSVSYFYDDLAPYGSWVDYGPYGWCWVPAVSAADWRPYEDGYWVMTDYGWTWVSYEPWGWATCHYGRWDYDAYYGWIWVPGNVWAPAWVAWQCDDDWVGWAPLPPQATWQVSVGLRFGDADQISASRWCFVPTRNFCDTKVRTHVVSVARNEWLIQRTHDVTRFDVRDGRPVNRGVDVRFVERGQGKRVRQLQLIDADSPQKRAKQSRDRIAFYRPSFREEELRSGPPPDKRGRSFATAEPELRKRHDQQRRDFDQRIARDRSKLEQEHARQLRAARGREAEKIRQQQAQESQSFDRQAAAQRQRLAEQQQKRVASAEKGKAQDKPHGKGKGKGGNQGGGR